MESESQEITWGGFLSDVTFTSELERTLNHFSLYWIKFRVILRGSGAWWN